MIPVKLKLGEGATQPFYATTGSAGFDISSTVKRTIYPGETALIPTGLFFEIPEGYELQIRPRSGMSIKTKVRVANSPGTIDSDFRGEVKIIVDYIVNGENQEPYVIEKGDRICQGVIQAVEQAIFLLTEELNATVRGFGGFGHSGYNASNLVN